MEKIRASADKNTRKEEKKGGGEEEGGKEKKTRGRHTTINLAVLL